MSQTIDSITQPTAFDATLTKPERIVSIDVFRGITMAVMIFVNALGEVHGLPWWTYHAHADQDVMTYVDMVFPTFLFIVGMSMPIAISQRLKRNPSQASLWTHVLTRVVSLIGIGLILANAEKADASRMPFNGNVWGLIGLLSAALLLNVYPKSTRFPKYSLVLKAIGLVGVVFTYAVFRRSGPLDPTAVIPHWIDFGYPEILGLIGFSYLSAAILYIPTRHLKWAPTVWFLLALGFNITSTARWIPLPGRMPMYEFPIDNGAMVTLIMAGVITSQLFVGASTAASRSTQSRGNMLKAVAIAVVILIAGYLLMPLGISKIRATPTWVLWSIGAAMLLFTLLYWVCDVKRKTQWALPVRSAGSNTFLTYLLPDFWEYIFAVLGITYLDTHFNHGTVGVVKTVVFTFVILGISTLLTRAKLRLQL